MKARKITISFVTISGFLAATLAGPGSVTSPTAVQAQVSTADEICSPTEDPCVISEVIDVANGAVLNFGVRTVRIIDRGELNVGAGTMDIFCGRLEAVELGGLAPTPIRARGPNLFGLPGQDGGEVTIRAERLCSEDANQTCINDIGCDLGSCNTFVCTGDSNRTCANDGNCDTGPCVFSPLTNTSRCGGSGARCETDSDCLLGTCDLGSPVCSGSLSRSCTVDDDCNVGQCSIGYGDVNIEGRIRADGVVPGSISISAVGDVLVNEILLDTSNREEDGGFLSLDSRSGDVIINGQINARGGNQGQGGDLTITAGRDLVVNEKIDINGGGFDGGFLDVFVGRDAVFADDILASSVNLDGFGGETSVFADRDINVMGPATWSTIGNVDPENFCGEGGPQEFDAGRNIYVDSSVLFQADGPPPDCGGEEVNLTAGLNVFMAADVSTRSRGGDGNGGLVEINAGEMVSVSSDSSFDVRGGSLGGGTVDITAGTNAYFDGSTDATTGSGGLADLVSITADCLIDFGGSIEISGASSSVINGVVDIDGGDVVIDTGASIANSGSFGQNFIRGSEYVTIRSGSTISVDATGANNIDYRREGDPPVINGTVTPAPIVTLDPLIPVSPCVCGNGAIEKGESCDDGNRVDGDGCSSACQAEGCLAATPGYPTVPLCDDGNDCTVDSCNPQTGQCQNVIDCDDGIACTSDQCVDLSCQHTPNNALCDDGDACTDDLCTVSTGCVGTFNTAVCDDGIGCTANDVCDRGTCAGTPSCPPGSLCDLELGQCVATVACGNSLVEPPEQCDDGDTEWNPGEPCNATCDLLICGDPDDSGSVNASDALYALRTAVSLETCDVCVCSVDGNQNNSATDALAVLRFAVALPVTLSCPPCDP